MAIPVARTSISRVDLAGGNRKYTDNEIEMEPKNETQRQPSVETEVNSGTDVEMKSDQPSEEDA